MCSSDLGITALRQAEEVEEEERDKDHPPAAGEEQKGQGEYQSIAHSGQKGQQRVAYRPSLRQQDAQIEDGRALQLDMQILDGIDETKHHEQVEEQVSPLARPGISRQPVSVQSHGIHSHSMQM